MTRRTRIEAIVVAAIVSACTTILLYRFCFSRTFLYQRTRLLFAAGRYEEALPLYREFLRRYSADEYALEARDELKRGKNAPQLDAAVMTKLQEQCDSMNARDVSLGEFSALFSAAAGVSVLTPIGIDKRPDTRINLDVRPSASFESILDTATKQKNLTWIVRNQAVIITDADTIPSIEDKHLPGEHLKGANETIIAKLQKQCGVTFPGGDITLEDLRQIIAPLAGVNIFIDPHSQDPVSPPETLPLADSPFTFQLVNPQMTFENILNNVSVILDADWLVRHRTVIIAEPKVISAIEKRVVPKELPKNDRPEYLMNHAVWDKLRKESGITFPGGETTLEDLTALIAPLAEVSIIIDPRSRAPDKLPLAKSPFSFHTVTNDLTFEDILNLATMLTRTDWTVRNRAVAIAEPDAVLAMEKRPQTKERPPNRDDAQVWERLQKRSGITFPGGLTTLENIRRLIAPLAEVNMIIDPYSRAPDGLPLADSPFSFPTVVGDLTFEDIINGATSNFLRGDWTIRDGAVIIAQPGRIESAALAIRDDRIRVAKPRVVSPPLPLPALIAALKSEDRFVRLSAAGTLGGSGARAVQPLIAALTDKNTKAREGAAMALGMTNDPRSVKHLIAALSDEDPDVRGMAAAALGWLKDPRSVAPLIVAMNDKDSDVRRRAAWALGWIGDSRALEALIAGLADRDRTVLWQIGRALGRMKDPRAIAPLIQALKNSPLAGRALIEIGEPAVNPLIVAAKDERETKWFRSRVAMTLGDIRDARAVQPLISILSAANEDAHVRQAAARALGMIGDARAIEPLVNALGDKSEPVQWGAADALMQMNDRRAIEPLIAVMGGKRAREWAEDVLRRITGEKLGRDPAKWRKWWEQEKKTNR